MKCKKTTVIVDNVGRQTIGDINNYIVELEQQCKKQKEVIDKLNDLLSDGFLEVIDRDILLDILKEVSE